MARFFDALDDKLIAFIERQPVFFIASAAATLGRINLSPKGLNTFRVLTPKRCAYLDITGSGNETAAHARADGRVTLMFCSFTRNPLILRLYGRAKVGGPGGALWKELAERFHSYPGARQIIAIDIESAQTSCGYGVPEMSLKRERSTMSDYWLKQGEGGAAEFREKKNRVSIDGLPTGLGET
jgi:pyridoxamine 5'-phosphate oxidase-like protein